MFSLYSSLTFVTALCLISGKKVNTQLLKSAVIVADDGYSRFDIANSFRSCGGQGTLIKWTADACNIRLQVCEYPIDGITRSARITFVPSKNADQLGLRMFASENAEQSSMLLDVPLQNSSVEGGHTYNLITTGAVSDGIRGIKSTAQVVLYRLSDQVIEICAEKDFVTV